MYVSLRTKTHLFFYTRVYVCKKKKRTSCHPLGIANMQLPLSFAQVLCEEILAPPG